MKVYNDQGTSSILEFPGDGIIKGQYRDHVLSYRDIPLASYIQERATNVEELI
jgi:hypothetical protein